jgi:hypothetical protein
MLNAKRTVGSDLLLETARPKLNLSLGESRALAEKAGFHVRNGWVGRAAVIFEGKEVLNLPFNDHSVRMSSTPWGYKAELRSEAQLTGTSRLVFSRIFARYPIVPFPKELTVLPTGAIALKKEVKHLFSADSWWLKTRLNQPLKAIARQEELYTPIATRMEVESSSSEGSREEELAWALYEAKGFVLSRKGADLCVFKDDEEVAYERDYFKAAPQWEYEHERERSNSRVYALLGLSPYAEQDKLVFYHLWRFTGR